MAEAEPDVATHELGRAGAVLDAALHRAAQHGTALPPGLRLWRLADRTPATAVSPPGPPRRPGSVSAAGSQAAEPGSPSLAEVLEAATPAAERRATGLHVTPAWLADHLVHLALDGLDADPRGLTFCDPACGGGAFLLAAARALAQRGLDPRHVVRRQLWGADIDPVGLAAAEAELALWAGEPPPNGHLVAGDALMRGRSAWPDPPVDGFAAVVGNPPFLNQLGRATVRPRDQVRDLRGRFGTAVRPYTDSAWLFLMLGVELARPGGRVTLVQPLSLVAARDATAVRTALDQRAVLRELWVERRSSFAASVQVCAPVLEVCGLAAPPAGPAPPVPARPEAQQAPAGSRPAGPRPVPRAGAGDWAGRLADALGIPRVDRQGRGALQERAAVTAGFRDEYYGLVPLVREATPATGGEWPLVTVGVLDWGRCRWGERPTRFAKRRWVAPVVDLSRAAGDESAVVRGGARWAERMAVPKVVVATQTRVVEAAVDEAGTWVPSVPALVVVPRGGGGQDLWWLAAAIAAPTSTAWLFRRAPGTALSRGALKIAARDLAALPLPVDRGAWRAAAEALRAYTADPRPEAFEAFVAPAAAAYRADEAVVAWWRSRMPNRLRG